MRAIIAAAVVVAIGAGIYFVFIKDSAPYATYKAFSTALANGDQQEALRYADAPEALGGVDENRGQTAGGMPVDALVGISYSTESETKNPDGSVTVTALQSVRFDPPGASSAMGAMTAKYRQTAILHKSEKRWLVSSVQSELVEVRNWKGEKQ